MHLKLEILELEWGSNPLSSPKLKPTTWTTVILDLGLNVLHRTWSVKQWIVINICYEFNRLLLLIIFAINQF